ERLLGRHAAGQIDADDGLGRGVLGRGRSGLESEEAAEREAEAADGADVEEFAPAGAPRVIRAIAPGGNELVAHDLRTFSDCGLPVTQMLSTVSFNPLCDVFHGLRRVRRPSRDPPLLAALQE